MTLFYLLPPRPVLADHLADWLTRALPGTDWDVPGRGNLLEMLAQAATRPGVFLVHRDELPPGEATERGLVDGFGASEGDEVIEVRLAALVGDFVSRRWKVGADSCTAASA